MLDNLIEVTRNLKKNEWNLNMKTEKWKWILLFIFFSNIKIFIFCKTATQQTQQRHPAMHAGIWGVLYSCDDFVGITLVLLSVVNLFSCRIISKKQKFKLTQDWTHALSNTFDTPSVLLLVVKAFLTNTHLHASYSLSHAS